MRGVLAICALLILETMAGAADPTMRLRIAWGDGRPRQWQARISLSEGDFTDPQMLGLEPDEPGSLRLTEEGIDIQQRSPRSYDGVDVGVVAPLESTLQLELVPLDDPPAAKKWQVALSQFVTDNRNESLDDAGNRLVIGRAPGDPLRIRFDAPHLVFSPGEKFPFEVVPQLLGFTAGTTVQLRVELVDSVAGDVRWKTEQNLHVADDGSIEPVPVTGLILPADEGVYHLVVTASKWRLRAPFVGTKPDFQRKVQLTVVDERPRGLPSPVAAASALQLEIDPSDSKWWKRLTRLPQLAVIPGWGRGPLDNGKTSQVADRPLVSLEVDGWQAYPLPISHPGRPHILEIEYPGDRRQTLGISIVEPDEMGKVGPLGVDSGIDVTPPPVGNRPTTEVHRLPFWPRTKAPLVLLANYRHDAPAVYGRIRVYEGLGTELLPPAESVLPPRLAAAYFAKPFFKENFSASKGQELATQRPLDDWVTFYQGGRRLVEYLQYSGQNSAVVAAMCEGSGLYPSRLLEPTPKFDTGTFFAEGRDPLRKDVLEMLLRMFDREQMTLIPTLQFAAPLPELEALLHDPEQPGGIEWMGGNGRTWRESFGSRGGLAPYYNPLDDRVQAALVRVVRELVDRYSHHPSFGGVALALDPNGYAQLPGSAWGFDDRTVAQFTRDTKTEVPGTGEDRFAVRQEFLLGEGKKKWLAWRSQRLAELYVQMRKEVTQANARARLYLVGTDLLDGQAVRMAMQPALPRRYSLADALLEMGLDPAHYAADDHLVLLRPHECAPITSLVDQAVSHEVEMTPAVDRLFEAHFAGSVFYHKRLEMRLPEFDAVSPFGPENTWTHLFSHVAPAGPERRKRLVHSLAALDAQVAFEGGWLLPLGQEDAIRDVWDTYRRLPAVPFETFQMPAPIAGREMQPVTVRSYSTGKETYVYFVNDSPWQVTAEVELDVSDQCHTRAVSPLRPVPPLARQGNHTTWSLVLRPYDLVAAVLSEPNVEFRDALVTVDPTVIAELRRAIRDIGDRADSLKTPKTMPGLQNADFEKTAGDQPLPDWRTSPPTGTTVAVAPGDGQQGGNALRLQSQGPVVWVRSQPIEPPKTGRLHVAVWLRVPDPQQQPSFRLAVDGRHLGRPYYRYAVVGAGTTPLTTDWAYYVFQVNDLPVSGWEKLEIGFDLMGAGEVLVDDVEIYDKRFNPNEQRELSSAWVALADLHLRQGKLGDCQRVLESYWPQFLLTYVPPPPQRMAQNPQLAVRPAPAPPPVPPRTEPPPAEPTPTMRDRVRSMTDALRFW